MDENVEVEPRGGRRIDDLSRAADREGPTSPDTILSAVANEDRRAILDSLTRTPEKPLEYDALVDRVADVIRDEDTERVSDEQRQRARIRLHHTHLPKLEEAGIIDYEADTGRVRFVGGQLEQDILRLIESHDVHE